MLKCSAGAVGVFALLEMRRAYVSLLESEIFPFERSQELPDRKMVISFKRALMGELALDVLFFVWSHSKRIHSKAVQYELSVFKPVSEYTDFSTTEITQHGIAVALAKTPRELSAINSNVRTILLAAEFFRQIKRIKISQTRVHLEATERLDVFIKKLDDNIMMTLTKIESI